MPTVPQPEQNCWPACSEADSISVLVTPYSSPLLLFGVRHCLYRVGRHEYCIALNSCLRLYGISKFQPCYHHQHSWCSRLSHLSNTQKVPGSIPGECSSFSIPLLISFSFALVLPGFVTVRYSFEIVVLRSHILQSKRLCFEFRSADGFDKIPKKG